MNPIDQSYIATLRVFESLVDRQRQLVEHVLTVGMHGSVNPNFVCRWLRFCGSARLDVHITCT